MEDALEIIFTWLMYVDHPWWVWALVFVSILLIIIGYFYSIYSE